MDMATVKVQDVERDPKSLLHRVEAGETLVITRDGQPIAEVKPVKALLRGPRPHGLCAGQFTVPDDFDAPLPDSILNDFEPK
jgi:antitoxin (DNA-binding transcriptional repressor) of toxin-antitoxin stability system